MMLLIAVSTSVLPVSEAIAQMSGGFGSGLGGGMGGRSHGNRNAESGADHKANAEKAPEVPDPTSYEQINYRLSLIQEELKLEPAQIGVWLTFSSKVRAFALDIAREKTYASASSFQAVGLQHIGQSLDTARNRLTALEEVESSAKPLYLVLKPEQKSLLDIRIPTVVAPRPVPPGAVSPNSGMLR